MDAQRFIEMHRTALRQAEAEGLTSVPTSTLHLVFDDFEKHVVAGNGAPNTLELEKFRSDLAGSLAYQEHVHNWSLESFKQVIALGQSTLKAIMLINGGAAVALLAFLGNILSKSHPIVGLHPFASSMLTFVLGVLLSAVAYALTYLSQLGYSGTKPWQQKTGVVLHVLTGLTGAFSMGAFLWGAKIAYHGFTALAP